MRDDRTVHAQDRYVEVVRYDRAGKWYLEPLSKSAPVQRVTIASAARRASVCPKYGGKVNFGRHGGSTFDRMVRKLT